MKMLNRLNTTKTTIPSIEVVKKAELKNASLKNRLSTVVKEDPMVKLAKIKVQKKYQTTSQ